MKLYRSIYTEPELRPDGTAAIVCTLMTPDGSDLGDNGPVLAEQVAGLNDTDVIAEGSTLITPTGKFIAFADNYFTRVGESFDGELPGWMGYVVRLLDDADEGRSYGQLTAPLADGGAFTVPGAPAAPAGMAFVGWRCDGTSADGDTVSPGEQLTTDDDAALYAVWTDGGPTGGLTPLTPGGNDGRDGPGGLEVQP